MAKALIGFKRKPVRDQQAGGRIAIIEPFHRFGWAVQNAGLTFNEAAILSDGVRRADYWHYYEYISGYIRKSNEDSSLLINRLFF